MVNKIHSIEWLEKAYHDLDSAIILYNADHYTDTIGYILHQSIEKTLKSIIAYQNNPILKTHNLIELNELLSDITDLDNDADIILAIATTYHTKQRYPAPNKRLPPRKEIKEVLDFAQDIFDKVCKILEIDKSELI